MSTEASRLPEGPAPSDPSQPSDSTGPTQDAPAGRRSLGGHLMAALKEIVIVVTMALALSFIVKTFLVQAFYIPSGSMETTLIRDDRVIVNKLVPRLIDLKRGDVVVFQDPDQWLGELPTVDRGPVRGAIHQALTFVGLLPSDSDHLIKRVIGLPGDRVTCCVSGKLTVNGVPVTEPYVKAGDAPSSLSFDVTVPAEHIWVMGDHRSNSEDSRFHDPSGTGADGSVPIAKVTGRAISVVWPIDRWAWLSDFAETFSGVPAPGAIPTSSP